MGITNFDKKVISLLAVIFIFSCFMYIKAREKINAGNVRGFTPLSLERKIKKRFKK